MVLWQRFVDLEKEMRCSNTLSFVIFACLILLLSGCASMREGQGTEAVTSPLQPMLEAAEEEAPGEVPVAITYSFSGDSVTVKAFRTYAEVSYTADLSGDTVRAFLAREAGRYPEAVRNLTYKLVDNTVTLTYGEELTEGDRRAFATMLLNDVYEATGAAGMLTVEHMTGDGRVLLMIYTGRAKVSGYSGYLSDEALGYVLAAVNGKYASVLGGIRFKAAGDGTMELRYPRSVPKADVASFAQLAITGLQASD